MIDLKKILKNVCIFATIFTCVLGVFVSSKIDLFADDSVAPQPIAVGDGGVESSNSVGDYIDGVKVGSIKNGVPYSVDGVPISVNNLGGLLSDSISTYALGSGPYDECPFLAEFNSNSYGFFYWSRANSDSFQVVPFLCAKDG